MATCGNCGNALIRLEREGLLERYILSLIGLYPWRCRTCSRNTYLFTRNE
jgi:hypothetical protein